MYLLTLQALTNRLAYERCHEWYHSTSKGYVLVYDGRFQLPSKGVAYCGASIRRAQGSTIRDVGSAVAQLEGDRYGERE